MARIMKQSGPPKQLLGTLPDPQSQHMPQRTQNAYPAGFDNTIRAVEQDAVEGSDAQGIAPTQPGGPGTGLQGLPDGVRDVIVSADAAHWHVP